MDASAPGDPRDFVAVATVREVGQERGVQALRRAEQAGSVAHQVQPKVALNHV
jgi:hypothetical protein